MHITQSKQVYDSGSVTLPIITTVEKGSSLEDVKCYLIYSSRTMIDLLRAADRCT
jgi:hypothetical protein